MIFCLDPSEKESSILRIKMLKIVSGKYRSREIDVPGPETVPTKNMVRTGIGNALTNDVWGASVLDLFAGSGALGIECLSRGAKECDFVDVSNDASTIIRNNLSKLQETNGRVFCGSFLDFIASFNENKKYDIILLDPPYKEKGFYFEATNALLEKNLLSENALIVMEYEGGEPAFPKEAFHRIRTYHYGRTYVTICWRKER